MSKRLLSADLRRRAQTVLTAIELAKEHGVWVEVSNLVIPTLNDDPKLFIEFGALDGAQPRARYALCTFWVFSPTQAHQPPVDSEETLVKARDIARDQGLRYVYIGNATATTERTPYCPHDGRLVNRTGAWI